MIAIIILQDVLSARHMTGKYVRQNSKTYSNNSSLAYQSSPTINPDLRHRYELTVNTASLSVS